MILGIAGSRHGMSVAQKAFVRKFVAEYCEDIDEVHHSDTLGAADESDTIVRTFARGYCRIVAHPSNMEVWQANTASKRGIEGCHDLPTVTLRPRPIVLRNCDIVEAVDTLIVVPKSRLQNPYMDEWFMYTYAMKLKKRVILVNPDGGVVKQK